MAGGVHVLASGAQDATSVPAASKVTANNRVMTAAGPLSLVTGILTFPGPSTVGNWISSNQRVLVNGVPTVSQSATGQAIVPGTPPITVPVMVVTADPRVSAD